MVFLFVFFFVCTSGKSTFLNRSDNTRRHLCLHVVTFSPSSALPATYFPCRTLPSLTMLSPLSCTVCVVPKYWKFPSVIWLIFHSDTFPHIIFHSDTFPHIIFHSDTFPHIIKSLVLISENNAVIRFRDW